MTETAYMEKCVVVFKSGKVMTGRFRSHVTYIEMSRDGGKYDGDLLLVPWSSIEYIQITPVGGKLDG